MGLSQPEPHFDNGQFEERRIGRSMVISGLAGSEAKGSAAAMQAAAQRRVRVERAAVMGAPYACGRRCTFPYPLAGGQTH